MGFTQLQFNEMLARVEAGKRKSNGEPPPLPVDAPKLERELHSQISSYCRDRGWIALHGSMAQATARNAGEPDFCVLADNGRVFWVECKTATGKLTLEQLGMHQWMARLGHKACVVRSFSEFLAIVNA